MRIGTGYTGTDVLPAKRSKEVSGKRFAELGFPGGESGNTGWATVDRHLPVPEDPEDEDGADGTGGAKGPRSEAEEIYQAAVAGKPNPIGSMRECAKVPYGHLAKDGVIEYNGVVFVCDERTNSICLGDMTDEKNVLNIPLSGGGHLKVNRNSIGLLSKAAGMFSPEDLNLIMRAIAEDTKIQSVKKEIEDEEASMGNQLRGDGAAEADESVEEDGQEI